MQSTPYEINTLRPKHKHKMSATLQMEFWINIFVWKLLYVSTFLLQNGALWDLWDGFIVRLAEQQPWGLAHLIYHKTSDIRRTLVGNKIVDHSDVVRASPVGAAPTTSSFST